MVATSEIGHGIAMRLVCGFDGTPAAQAAACAAAAVARRMDVELTLVHVLPASARRRGRDAVPPAVRADDPPSAPPAVDALAAHRRTVDALAELTGAAVSLRIEHGDPVAALRRVAREARCDLLVVGQSPQRRRFETLLPGVTRRLAAAPPCPLAIVPEDASVQLPERIVAGCHGVTASHAATAFAGRLAAKLGVQLTLLQEVESEHPPAAPTGWERYDAPRRHRRVARAAAGRRNLPIELVDQDGAAAATLAPDADDEAAAWIVVGAPGGRARRWGLPEPEACGIAASTAMPVVVVPDRVRA